MSENRRERDRSASADKGPLEKIGGVLMPEHGALEIPGIRQSDLEPYVGLGYLSKLFKLMGVILGLLLIAEIVTGMIAQGSAAIPTLLGEASRLIVLAGLLWGVGDLAILLIDVGHDVRAARIMMAREHRMAGGESARRERALSDPSEPVILPPGSTGSV